jgi:putative nucleotidyltransferase with HDIG domain
MAILSENVHSPLGRRLASAGPVIWFFVFLSSLTLLLTAILTFQFLPSRLDGSPGTVARQTVKAPERVTYTSKIRTEDERARAAASVPEVPKFQSRTVVTQIELARTVLSRISDIRTSALNAEEKREALRSVSGVTLSPESIATALALDPVSWQTARGQVEQFVSDYSRQRISPDQLRDVRARVTAEATLTLPLAQGAFVGELAAALIQPNVTVDLEETEKQRQAARDAVAPVVVTIQEGETLLREGDVVTPLDREKLEAVGLLSPNMRWSTISGVLLLSFLLSLAVSSYIYLFRPRLLLHYRRLLLILGVFVGSILAYKLMIPGRSVWAGLFPYALAPMIVAALLSPELGLLLAAVMSVFFAYVAGSALEFSQLEILVMSLAGGITGVLGLWRLERLSRFFIAGFAVSLSTFAVIVAFKLPQADVEPSRLLIFAITSLANGVLCASLTIGAFWILGHIAGITTSLHLMELAHPSQPLLRELLTKAPGTYHHSIMVGNLAERAAEAIGADALLVRVGAYYHDVGKMLRPGYFVENQMYGPNIHDQLTPLASAQAIATHVTEGQNLARRYGIPSRVRDFIPEHHGTRLASFFYDQARLQDEEIDPELFRYPGPRPQSRETALIMLADGVEATVRAGQERSAERMAEIVERIIDDRIREGQLDECDLTLRDLQVIRESFKSTLQAMYHPRIEYPDFGRKRRRPPRGGKQIG